MKPHPRQIRRTLPILVLLLIAGAMINIAVAWGAGTLTNYVHYDEKNLTNGDTKILQTQCCGFDKRGAMQEFGVRDGNAFVTILERGECVIYLQGWPLRSMMGRSLFRSVESSDTAFSFAFFKHRSGRGPDSYGLSGILALVPVWPGFALNTIIFATTIWLLFAAPFALRSWRRSKRGLCPKCAYPIGTSDTCTECGRPVRHSRAGHPSCLRRQASRGCADGACE